MWKPTPKVFLDANIVIGAGKPPGGPELTRVTDLVEAGIVSVLTTDLTIIEVAKKHASNDFEAIRDICQPHFRKIVADAMGIALPTTKRADLRATLDAKFRSATEVMFKRLKAKTLTIDDIAPSTVFSAYAAGEGFFSGEGKKDQFPDAFAFECLKKEATELTPVIIVSQDGDFIGPVRGSQHLSLVKSLPELFAALGLEIEDPEIEEFLAASNAKLVEMINYELSDQGLEADDVDDAEIDEIVVSALDFEVTTAFRSIGNGPILVVGQASVTATLSYTHPNWDDAIWDSEDKVAIPFEDVGGETEVEMTIDVSLSVAVNGNREPVGIEEISFRGPDYRYVTLHPPDYL